MNNSLRVGIAMLFACAPLLAAEPPSERQRELVRMVRQDCGSCHGMTLNGGLGPALTVEALRERDIPKESLVATIVGGRPGTPMPPWHRFLSEAEAGWIVDRLLEGFPQQ
ncbi:MAG: cytochrome c55X [Pseudomonadota bacterium]|nr:cytochrome c55X [Pseudomonadota bacterium]MDQ5905055.1 cytochrome c55X [Pseudomonadota bacterium]MDQ5918927.1 cytochrome c55X [Pseudomonadota bacterium]MDQ5943178.1 cytochrome c55X [Pseudomonadota bacterium]